VIIPSARRWPLVPLAIALVAALGGSFAAWHYHRLDLTLSHYDARGHLIVARRIADNLTPGWQQIGAVWLPLPHLLNAIPVQADRLYRTGASAVAISVFSYAITAGAIGWILQMLTASLPAAAAGAAIFALNPNVLYLQSTPMTEPLLLATTTIVVALLIAWCHEAAPLNGAAPRSAALQGCHGIGIACALACLTRYEAWPATIVALAAAAWTRWRSGGHPAVVVREIATIALFPAVAIAGFAIFSRVVIGEWFLAGGFFVPENKALGDPMMAAAEIGWGARALSGGLLTTIAAAGLGIAVGLGLASRRRAAALVVVGLAAMAAIPFAAFVDGHPFRIRYMVPLMAIEAIGGGLVAGVLPGRRVRGIAAAALILIATYELRPLDASAPMVVEAQWDRPNAPVRARVTACLGARSPGRKIMASMGSLGHYMQEASASGFAVRDFLHEGNGDIWLAALVDPRPFADWILIEEKAEGGDMLAKLARSKPSFLDGFERACDGAGLVLYRRRSRDWGLGTGSSQNVEPRTRANQPRTRTNPEPRTMNPLRTSRAP
jgi:hypothetical protein